MIVPVARFKALLRSPGARVKAQAKPVKHRIPSSLENSQALGNESLAKNIT